MLYSCSLCCLLQGQVAVLLLCKSASFIKVILCAVPLFRWCVFHLCCLQLLVIIMGLRWNGNPEQKVTYELKSHLMGIYAVCLDGRLAVQHNTHGSILIHSHVKLYEHVTLVSWFYILCIHIRYLQILLIWTLHYLVWFMFTLFFAYGTLCLLIVARCHLFCVPV